LPSNLARQPCPAAFPGSLAPAALLGSSTNFDKDLMRELAPQSPYFTKVAGHQTAWAQCCPDRFKLVFSPISPCFHYVSPNCMRALQVLNLFLVQFHHAFRSFLRKRG
jgi:hypothetical protein